MGRHSSAKARASVFRWYRWSWWSCSDLLGWFGWDFVADRLGTASCDPTTTINVTAAPDIAPVIAGIAARTVRTGRLLHGQRGSRAIPPRRPSRSWSPTAPNSRTCGSPSRRSGCAARHARARGRSRSTAPPSPARRSYSALTEDAAGRLGWPGKQPTWAEGLDLTASARPIPASNRPGSPRCSPSADWSTPTRRGHHEAAELSANTVAVRRPVRPAARRQPQRQPVDGVPTAEHAVLRHNAQDEARRWWRPTPTRRCPRSTTRTSSCPTRPPPNARRPEKFLDRLQEQSRPASWPTPVSAPRTARCCATRTGTSARRRAR